MGDWTGTVPTLTSGQIPTGDDWKNILDELTAISAAWTSWTPTLTNLTLGSGLLTSVYRRVGKTMDYRFKFTYGAGSAVGTGPSFTLPAAPHSSYTAFTDSLGTGLLRDNSSGVIRLAQVFLSSGSTVQINGWSGTGDTANVTATAPWTWAAPDSIIVSGCIELA